MTFKFLLFYLITAVVTINLIYAEEDAERSLPFFSFLGGDTNSSSGLPNLPSFSDLPFFGSFGSGQLPSFFGSRQKRSADLQESDDGEEEPQNRLASIVSCNYTTQGGTRCASCRQSLACYPNNVGRLRSCRGLLRYCNNGRCSFVPGAECNSGSSGSGSGSSGSSSSGSSGSSGSGSSGSGSSGSSGSGSSGSGSSGSSGSGSSGSGSSGSSGSDSGSSGSGSSGSSGSDSGSSSGSSSSGSSDSGSG